MIDAKNRSYYVVSENQEGVESKKIIPQNAEGKIIRTEFRIRIQKHRPALVSREQPARSRGGGEYILA